MHKTKSEEGAIALMKNSFSYTENCGPCCCCLELVCVKSLWQEYTWMGGAEMYGKMINECFGLNMQPTGNRKDQICEICISQLRSALRFRKQMMECQKKLTGAQGIRFIVKRNAVIAPVANKKCTEVTKTACFDIKRESTGSDSSTEGENNIDDNNSPYEGNLNNLKHDKHPISSSEDDIPLHNMKKDTNEKTELKNSRLNPEPDRTKPVSKAQVFMNCRQNPRLIIGFSTITPFRFRNGYFICFFCPRRDFQFADLKEHVNEHHNNIDHRTIINSIYVRPRDRIKADISDITCKICKQKQENMKSLVQHLTEIHNKQFDYSTRIQPEDIIVGYDLKDGFKCIICKEQFPYFRTLSIHMNDHTSNYVCETCGRCFLLPERLGAHMLTHKKSTAKCEYCNRVFKSAMNLKSHIAYTHKQQQYNCVMCNQKFPNIKTRWQHLVEVHNQKPLDLKCKQCSKEFPSPSRLNAHIRVQHLKIQKEKKYVCHLCPMRFASGVRLKCHMLSHSGEKNYSCRFCHKKFGRAWTVREHMRIHTNDRRWQCGACDLAFIQKCSLKNHIRSHHRGADLEALIINRHTMAN